MPTRRTAVVETLSGSFAGGCETWTTPPHRGAALGQTVRGRRTPRAGLTCALRFAYAVDRVKVILQLIKGRARGTTAVNGTELWRWLRRVEIILYAAWVAYITLYFFLVAWAEIEAGAPDAGNAVILAVIYFMIALLPLPVIFGVMRAVGWALRRFWRASDRP